MYKRWCIIIFSIILTIYLCFTKTNYIIKFNLGDKSLSLNIIIIILQLILIIVLIYLSYKTFNVPRKEKEYYNIYG